MTAAANSGPATADVYLGLGSNIKPERFLPLAVGGLSNYFPITGRSSVWQTPAVGTNGPDFLNAVVRINTHLSPTSLKYRVLRPLEVQLGRVRTEDKNSPRTIDIDILVYNGDVLEKEIWRQPHLAVPLAELLPDLKRPDWGISLELIAEELRSGASIVRFQTIHL